MRRLMLLFLLLATVAALSVAPQEAYNAKIGEAAVFSISVDATSTITVDTENPDAFSWVEKEVYKGKAADLEFTPDSTGEHRFTVSDGSRRIKVVVFAVEAADYGYIEVRLNELAAMQARLELERQGYKNTDTTDIARTLMTANEHIQAASGAYNSSRYTAAEIELGNAEVELDSAQDALSEAQLRPKEGLVGLDLAIIIGIMVVVIAVAVKYFFL